MKLLNTLKNFPSAQKFLWFSLFFYFSMYLSKTIHALWFEENHALTSFGFSYTMMAVAGILSFFTGKLGDKISPHFALRLGVIVYAVGLALRVFTFSFWIAGISGFIAGLGASLVIISMRFWIVSLGTEEDRPALVSISEMGNHTGIMIGTSLSGILVWLFSYLVESPMAYVLILAALCCCLTIFLVPKFPRKVTASEESQTHSKKPLKEYKLMMIGIVALGMIAGVSVSLISPFIPVILKHQGISVSLIGLFMAMISLTAIFAAPIYASKNVSRYKQWLFFISELVAGLLLLLFLTSLPSLIILLILVFRAFLYTGSAIAQELIELELFPKPHLDFFFGLSQSSFFIGDALGGTFGGYLYNMSITIALVICTSLLIFNAFLLPLFFTAMKRHYKEGGSVH
ncbi:MFS transporter [Staphylococcus pseudintermedius]|uniref:MFS transporter n=1 Tax=Staphylococcus pseudintermedius TaxID=283734 RepID=UPI003F9C05E9